MADDCLMPQLLSSNARLYVASKDSASPSMRRYKGLAAGIASRCDAAVSVAQQAGVAHVSSLFSKDAAQSQNAFPEARNATDQILAALGELLALNIH